MFKYPALRVLAGGLAFCLVGVVGARTARADNLYGEIRGVVTDPSGAVVAGANITAVDLATGITTTTSSGEDGSFQFLQLAAPATYDVKADKSGFKTFQAKQIQLVLNQIYVLNITLEVGTTTQQVTVEANLTQVETTSIELGSNMNAKSIVDLPLNGRNWVQLQ